jgi:glycosyltransferase involved in cell wall biosynthesis
MKEKKKTLLYIGNKLANKGGTPTVIDTLSEQLIADGYVVITASDKKNKAHRLLEMVATFFRVRHRVNAVLIDTYSTKNFYFAILIGSLCRTYNIPYFPILHGGNLPQRIALHPRKSVKYFGGARLNIAPSYYLLKAFEAEGFTNLEYIPNAIEVEKYPFKPRKKVQPNLLWVRSFSEIYNPLLALEVLEQLIHNGHKASLFMVGPEKDGSLAKCKEVAARKSLPVTFTGLLSKESWIELSTESDVFINTTNFDNLPVSIIEAMALGFPIVSTNVGGLPYLIENEVDGFLVPPENAEAMVNAIELLCVDQNISEAMSQAAKLKVENYNWSNIRESWQKVLNF